MKKVIATVVNEQALDAALKSGVDTIFYLAPNINTLASLTEAVHSVNKKIFVHMDMAEGIGKDKFGIEFVSKSGVDGIISTRSNVIKIAKKYNITTVQRFFIIDSHSVNTTIETVNTIFPDMIEIMPGIAVKVIDKLKAQINLPIIAGGLIETEDEINTAINAGASAVSGSKSELWDI